jgi:signal transduction histidine kinase
VLIVDDNKNNLFTLHTLIQEYLDVHILEAYSGEKALKIVVTKPVDLIILDVQMPEMDGFKTAEFICSFKKTKHIPIVFLTAAYKSEEFQQQGFAIGAVDYLTKPIEPYQLINRIKTYIRFIEQDRQHKKELERKVQKRTAELLEAHDDLERRVEERTAELAIAKEKAEQAQAIAEKANHAKSKFIANMSHELRTPLNGILGYAQILNHDENLNPIQKEAISVIHSSGEYLLTLISDILDMSKIEADRIELCPSDFHFGDFLQSVVDLFKMRAKQKGISFIYEKLSHLPTGVHADEKRLRQILINLLNNAIKFTEKGCVSFKVGYHNGKLRFLVEDTGVGIATKELDQIFQPFLQVGDKNLRAEGTGLGLSITKKLVEIMGGKLHVNSTLGKGSAFWMTLDLLEVSDLVKSGKADEQNIVGYHGQSRHILVADDKEANRAVLINQLAPLGFEITEAVDGQDCVNKACEYCPDLILIDLVMPIMDGFEASRQIRRMPDLKEVIILMASASVFDCHKQQSMEACCNDFIAKPIYAEELFKLLEKYLGLTWIYDTEEVGTSKPGVEIIEQAEDARPLVGLSQEQAAILFDLGMKGDLDSIVERLDEFEQMDQRLTPFANQIRELAKNFEEEKICDLIEQYVVK